MMKLLLLSAVAIAIVIATMTTTFIHASRFTSGGAASPLGDQMITVTICQDPLCRFHCHDVSMGQNQCKNEGERGSQMAMCINSPGGQCVQQTLFGRHGGDDGGSSSSWSGSGSGSGADDEPCNERKVLSTTPHPCGQCIDNRGNAHGHSELEFIMLSNCDSANGTYTLHSGCTPRCEFCNAKINVEPKRCYRNQDGKYDMSFSPSFPCPKRLLVQNFWDQNCTGNAHNAQTTFQNSCYTQGFHSLKYSCN